MSLGQEYAEYKKNISAGNDESDGDAREEVEVRSDKDEDVKTGNDPESPVAIHEKKKRKIEPDSLSSPNANGGHSIGKMAEHEEPDPTQNDADDLKVDYPGENEKKKQYLLKK